MRTNSRQFLMKLIGGRQFILYRIGGRFKKWRRPRINLKIFGREKGGHSIIYFHFTVRPAIWICCTIGVGCRSCDMCHGQYIVQ